MMRRLTIEDFYFAKSVMLDDSVFPWICDDGTNDKSRFETELQVLLSREDMFFLSPSEYCIYMLSPFLTGAYVIHTCILPNGRGKEAFKHGRELLKYCFETLKMNKMISYVPSYNRKTLLYALRCGMKKEGTMRGAWQHDNNMYDVDFVGLTRQEWEQCQRR
jgi:hypothetical protein